MWLVDSILKKVPSVLHLPLGLSQSKMLAVKLHRKSSASL